MAAGARVPAGQGDGGIVQSPPGPAARQPTFGLALSYGRSLGFSHSELPLVVGKPTSALLTAHDASAGPALPSRPMETRGFVHSITARFCQGSSVFPTGAECKD